MHQALEYNQFFIHKNKVTKKSIYCQNIFYILLINSFLGFRLTFIALADVISRQEGVGAVCDYHPDPPSVAPIGHGLVRSSADKVPIQGVGHLLPSGGDEPIEGVIGKLLP